MIAPVSPNDGRATANVVGMTVRKNQGPEIARGVRPSCRIASNTGLLVGKTRVHNRKLVSIIEQYGIGRAQRYEIGSLDDRLQAHVVFTFPSWDIT